MAEDQDGGQPSHLFTSKRMETVWRMVHLVGYTNLKDFWEYAETRGWDFYDVLDIASP